MQTYKCIMFTDKDGNIINDDNDPENYITNNVEITGVDTTEDGNGDTQGLDITGVTIKNITGVRIEDLENENKNENFEHGNTND